jgi:CheY-like chemotaxis protein
VDDDPLVLRLYQDGLSHEGAQVETAADGLAAVQSLRARRPDLVVLDLMMPRFTGVDVLKFIRGQPNLADLPVVVLSNSYMNELAGEAVALGVHKALLKVRCSPTVLTGIINHICSGKPSQEDPAHLLAVPKETNKAVSAASPPQSPPAPPSPTKTATPPQIRREAAASECRAKALSALLDNVSATRAALRSLCQAFANAPNPAARGLALQNLWRKLHFIAATAGLAECHQLAQMASAFEALLFELTDKPDAVTPSVLRTIVATVDFVGLLLDRARDSEADLPPSAPTLVVDDDPLSNRLIVAALRRAHLQARSVEDPLVALQWLQTERYDLVLLDVEMPGMNGFELCRKLRLLPGYEKTPVIYVTSHSDFATRANSILSGGGDLISKPVFPMELAVKALTHLLRNRLGI